jgi:hypothetical protein
LAIAVLPFLPGKLAQFHSAPSISLYDMEHNPEQTPAADVQMEEEKKEDTQPLPSVPAEIKSNVSFIERDPTPPVVKIVPPNAITRKPLLVVVNTAAGRVWAQGVDLGDHVGEVLVNGKPVGHH